MPDKSVPFIIYKAVNKSSEKIYIGLTRVALKTRINQHFNYSGRRSIFQNALRRAGRDGFEFSIIDHADSSSQAQDKERLWIILLNSKAPAGYNLTDGGEGVIGLDSDSIRRMAESKRGRKATSETRLKMSLAQKRRTWTPEQRKAHGEKSRAFMLGRKLPDYWRESISKVQTGKKRGPLSDATKAKISSSQRGKIIPIEQREAISKRMMGNIPWNKGKTFTDEHRQRLSESHRGIKQSEQTRAKRSKTIRAAYRLNPDKWSKKTRGSDS